MPGARRSRTITDRQALAALSGMPGAPAADAATHAQSDTPVPLSERFSDLAVRARLLLVESDTELADRLSEYLKASGFTVYATNHGHDAQSLVRSHGFDLVIVDPELPDINDRQVLQQLSNAQPGMPIIIISANDTLDQKIENLANGADDYLTKPFHDEELLARIHAILRRQRSSASKTLQIGPLTLDLESRRAFVNGRDARLTGKEYSCLELLMTRQGMTVTKEMFLHHLYSGRDEPEMKIIDVFVCKLRRKLRDTGLDNLIETVWGRGYVIRAGK